MNIPNTPENCKRYEEMVKKWQAGKVSREEAYYYRPDYHYLQYAKVEDNPEYNTWVYRWVITCIGGRSIPAIYFYEHKNAILVTMKECVKKRQDIYGIKRGDGEGRIFLILLNGYEVDCSYAEGGKSCLSVGCHNFTFAEVRRIFRELDKIGEEALRE